MKKPPPVTRKRKPRSPINPGAPLPTRVKVLEELVEGLLAELDIRGRTLDIMIDRVEQLEAKVQTLTKGQTVTAAVASAAPRFPPRTRK